MEPIEAFEVLGLPPTADAEEIQRAFRQASHEAHPDTGGSDEEMHRVVTARDVALAWGAGRALPAVRREPLPARQTGTSDLPSQISAVSRHHVSRLKSYRRMIAYLTALLALAATAFSRLDALGIAALDIPPLFVIATVLAVGMSALLIIVSTASLTAEQSVEGLAEELKDPATFYEVGTGLFPDGGGPITRQALRQHVDWWLHETPRDFWKTDLRSRIRRVPRAARAGALQVLPIVGSPSVRTLGQRVGTADFARLLVDIGETQGYVTSKVEVDEGRPALRYRLTLPSDED